MTHWCHDIPRDEAVRAAEDSRDRPLPTLAEAIAAPVACTACGGFGMDHRCKESCDECDGHGRAMIPKSVSASSAVDHENKGDGMSGSTWFPASEQPAPAPPEATDGLRTERVTLEVTHGESFGVSHWSWVTILRIKSGESVRVVSDDDRQAPPTTKPATTENDYVSPAPVSRPAETRQTQAERVGGGWWFPKYDKPSAPPPPPPAPPRVHRGSGVFDANGDEVPWEGVVASLTAERDAAIRERDNERLVRIGTETDRDFARREKDAAIRHITELRTERDKLQARVAELEARTSTAGEGSCDADAASGNSQATLDGSQAASGGAEQPRGGLTAEERKWIEYMKGNCVLPYAGMACMEAILARSSPPEVVLTEFPPNTIRNLDSLYLTGWNQCMALAKKALAAAGVAVKETT
jgi:hypothetical protein